MSVCFYFNYILVLFQSLNPIYSIILLSPYYYNLLLCIWQTYIHYDIPLLCFCYFDPRFRYVLTRYDSGCRMLVYNWRSMHVYIYVLWHTWSLCDKSNSTCFPLFCFFYGVKWGGEGCWWGVKLCICISVKKKGW